MVFDCLVVFAARLLLQLLDVLVQLVQVLSLSLQLLLELLQTADTCQSPFAG